MLRILKEMRFLPPKIYAHILFENYTQKKLKLHFCDDAKR